MSNNCWMDKENEIYLYNRILSSNKTTEALVYATTWVNLENILNKRCQVQNTTYIMISFYEMSRADKQRQNRIDKIETESRLVVAQG